MGGKMKTSNYQASPCSYLAFYPPDLYKLTDEVLGQGAYAKVQGCISLHNGQEFAVKVSWDVSQSHSLYS